MKIKEYQSLIKSKPVSRRNVQIEDQEKKLFIKRMKLELPEYEKLLIPLDLHAVKLSIGQAVKLKALGSKKGVADYFLVSICLDYSDKHFWNGLFIEFKRNAIGKRPKGIQSLEQKEFQKHVEKNIYKYIIVHSADEAMGLIKEYLGL